MVRALDGCTEGHGFDFRQRFSLRKPDTTQLLTTSNFIGPWYHAALLFLGLGSIDLLFVLLFSQKIREDLVRAAHRPENREVAT